MTHAPTVVPALAAHVPEGVRALCVRLIGAGHEAYVVGGAVRDLLLQGRHAGGDWDVATSARPEVVVALFPRVVATGLQHGTVTVVDRSHGLTVEVTTYRSEGGYADGRRPDAVRFVSDLAEDLSRRDFTINAIALHPVTAALVDPFGGATDLAGRQIRAVGDARTRFSEDGLRPMRAVRFAAVLGFEIEPATFAAIAPCLPTFRRVATERVLVEWTKLLCAGQPSLGLRPMDNSGLLAEVLPALAALPALVRAASFARVDALPPDFPLRFAALHAALTPEEAELALSRLRPRQADARDVAALLRGLAGLARCEDADASVRRLLSRVGVANWPRVALLARSLSHEMPALSTQRIDALQARVDVAIATGAPLSLKALAVSGEDLEPLVGRGPAVGRLLLTLLDHVLDEPARNQRALLLEEARQRAEALLEPSRDQEP